MKNIVKIFMLSAVVAGGLASAFQAGARQINVRGIVSGPDGKPLNSVCIFDAATNQLLGMSNDEGKFLVATDDEGTLLFSVLGSEELEVPVEGRLTLDVTLVRESIQLEELQVKGKSKLKVVAPEPTDLELKGNYLTIKTRVRVPARLFNTSTRLIIQPELWNVSERRKQYMKPLVFDGWRYNVTQNRMLDFDAANEDPLWRFVEVRKSGGGDAMITYHDSVYVENPDQDFRCDMLMAMEDYNKVFYRDTTTIARGVVNPLRFFEYSMLGREVADSDFFPSPEMQLRDTRGDVMLTFDLGKATLDMSRPENRHSLDSLINALHAIEDNPDAAIKSFSIFCTSSPDGNYQSNLELSKRRMESALETIFNNLSPNTRKYAERSTDSKVESWSVLVDMLRADSLNEEADEIQKAIDRYGDKTNGCSNRIRNLSFYRPLITDTYLPRMRRVSYEFITSQYRYLTDAEIAEVYAKDPASLSQFEYFRLYRYGNLDEAAKEKVLRDALKAHPRFVVAANDLAAMLINRGEPDSELLESYLDMNRRKLPHEVRYNEVAAYLTEHRYREADSLARLLPYDDGLYDRAKTHVAIFNGQFDVDMSDIAKESPINEVVVLLCVNADRQAWNKAQLLGDSAEEEYIKALAANRVDEYEKAMHHFKKALQLKPELRETARVDGDMIELLEDLEGEQ